MDMGIDLGQVNLACCVLDRATGRIARWAVLDLTEGQGAKKMTIEQLVERAVGLFEPGGELLADVGRVFIEAQPCGRGSLNIKTKVLSHALQALFLSQGLATSFVNPKAKQPKGLSYAQRKRSAVNSCAALLEGAAQDEVHRDYFRGLKKKDDAADSFLVAWIGQGRALPAQEVAEKKPRQPKQPKQQKEPTKQEQDEEQPSV